MSTFLQVIKILLFALSLTGIAGLFEIWGVPRQLKWLCAVEAEIIFLYFLALVNLLVPAYWILLVFGLAAYAVRLYLVYSKKWQPRFRDARAHLVDFWMLFFAILFIVQLVKSPLVHYDNYSHWAVMVKYMYFEGHLPIGEDNLVTFTSYLPGTSLFIVNCLQFFGFGEGQMMVGQFIIIWVALLSLLSVLPDQRKRLNQAIIMLGIALSMVVNISIRTNNLLVDYVLAVVTAGGFAGIYALRQKKWQQLTFFAMTAAVLMLVKNSGPFFAASLLIFMLYENQGWGRIKSVFSFAISFIPFGLWQWHVKTTFTVLKNHAISMDAYQKQLAGESEKSRIELAWRVVHHLLNWNTASTRYWLILNLFVIILAIVVNGRMKKGLPLLRVMAGLNLMIALFYVSLYATYALTMTPAEAKTLNGFERYMSTVINIALLAIAELTAVMVDRCYFEQNIEKRNLRSYKSIFTKNCYQFASLIGIVFATIVMLSEVNGIAFNSELNQTSMPMQLKKLSPEVTRYNHQKILLVDSEPSNVADDYDYFLGRYYYFSDQVKAQEAFQMSLKEFKACLEKYDYVVLPVKHQTWQKLAHKVYHRKFEPGIYKLKGNNLLKVETINH